MLKNTFSLKKVNSYENLHFHPPIHPWTLPLTRLAASQPSYDRDCGWPASPQLHESKTTSPQLPASHVGREAGSTFKNQFWKEFWMPHAFKIPKYTNCSNTPLIGPISMDSDSRHSISLLYIPWGKIWSTCSKPFTEETTVLCHRGLFFNMSVWLALLFAAVYLLCFNVFLWLT